MANTVAGALQLAPLAAFSVLVLTGCPVAPTFSTGYAPARYSTGHAPVDAILAVRRFTDKRPPRVYTTQGRMFLTYVPLLPYVSLPFERMDENVRVIDQEIAQFGGTTLATEPMPPAPDFYQYAYPDSIARAIADDIRQQGLFREVTYIDDLPLGGERYVLDGVLQASPLQMTATSYCLGPPGVLLWLLALPVGKASAAINVSLTLTDTTNGAVVWQSDLHADISRIVTLYTSEGIIYGTTWFSYQMVFPPLDVRVDRRSLFAWHFESLRRAMQKAIPELAAALARTQ